MDHSNHLVIYYRLHKLARKGFFTLWNISASFDTLRSCWAHAKCMRHAENDRQIKEMKKGHKILLGGLIAVGLLDTFGSIASRQLDFDYSLLSFVSFIIYGTTCFLATKAEDLKTGVTYGMILGFFDSTIGLKISMLLGANTGDHNYEITTAFWIFIVVYMIGFGALAGLIGGGLARVVKKRGTNAQHKL